METVSSLLMAGAAILFVVLLIKVITKPIKAVLKFLLHAAFGYALLFLVSFLGEYVGLSIEMSPLNIVIAALAGVPGVGLIVLAQLLF